MHYNKYLQLGEIPEQCIIGTYVCNEGVEVLLWDEEEERYAVASFALDGHCTNAATYQSYAGANTQFQMFISQYLAKQPEIGGIHYDAFVKELDELKEANPFEVFKNLLNQIADG